MPKLQQPSYRQLQEFWKTTRADTAKPVARKAASLQLSVPAMRDMVTLSTQQAIKGHSPVDALQSLRDKLALASTFITGKALTIPLHEVQAHHTMASAMAASTPGLEQAETHINLEKGIPVLRTVLPLKRTPTLAYEVKSRIPQAPLNEHLNTTFELNYGVNLGHQLKPVNPADAKKKPSNNTVASRETSQQASRRMLEVVKTHLASQYPKAQALDIFRKSQ